MTRPLLFMTLWLGMIMPSVRAADEAVPRPAAPAPLEEVVAQAKAAYEAGHLHEADRLYRYALRLKRDDEASWYGLAEVAAAQTLSSDSAPFRAARARLEERFVIHETSHFIILSDADRQWVRIQGMRLERARKRFLSFANGLEMRPLPLRHKLVAILFSSRDDFVAFSRAEHGPAGASVAGYYHPRADHLVFYHSESAPNIEASRDFLLRMQGRIDQSRQNLRRLRNRQSRGPARELRRQIRDDESRRQSHEAQLNAFARRRTIQVTLHEAVHALSFHTEVQSPRVPQPRWLSEGLATCFETDEPGLPFGPQRDFLPRRERFLELLYDDKLFPLETLVRGLDATRMTGAATDVLYHQSYALVTYLGTRRRHALSQYLKLLNDLPAAPITADEHVAHFEQAFGPLRSFERTWLEYEGR